MENCLTEKIVRVVPIIRQGNWLPKGHDGEFMFSGTAKKYQLPIDGKSGQLIDPLKGVDTDTLTKIAEVLSLTVADLHVRKKDNNFWKTKEVSIEKTGREFHLNKVDDFIDYRLIACNTRWIASSWNDRFKSGEFHFALVDEGIETIKRSATEKQKMDAYMKLGEIRGMKDKMSDAIRMYWRSKMSSKKPSSSWDENVLISELGKVATEDPEGFVKVMDQKDYSLKILILKGIDTGALELYDKINYRITGMTEGLGTFDQVVSFYKDELHQEEKMKLMARIERSD